MKILSFLTDSPVLFAILSHLELRHQPPPVSPARGPGRAPRNAWSRSVVGDLLLDQTPAFDPTEAEPIPEFSFDQSLPDEFDH